MDSVVFLQQILYLCKSERKKRYIMCTAIPTFDLFESSALSNVARSTKPGTTMLKKKLSLGRKAKLTHLKKGQSQKVLHVWCFVHTMFVGEILHLPVFLHVSKLQLHSFVLHQPDSGFRECVHLTIIKTSLTSDKNFYENDNFSCTFLTILWLIQFIPQSAHMPQRLLA